MIFKKYIHFTLVGFALCISSACNKWVTDVPLPDNLIDETKFNNISLLGKIDKESFILGVLTAGVIVAGANAVGNVLVASAAMVDEISSTKVPNNQFYRELDDDKLLNDNTSLYSLWSSVQNYRARAEDLLNIANSIQPKDEDETKIKQYATFYAQWHAGYAWMLLADYFSVNKTDLRIFVNGNSISHTDAYKTAENYWQEALRVSIISATEKQLIQSLLAKLGIQTGNYALAVANIENTFTSKANFSFLNTIGTYTNAFFNAVNINSRDAAVDDSFVALLITKAAKERNKVSKAKAGHWALTQFAMRDPLIISDWDEMQLIKAELILRGLYAGDTLALINSVIAKYDSSEESKIKTVTLNDIPLIRHLFLSFRGTRLLDLRRFQLAGDGNLNFQSRIGHWIAIPEQEFR